MVAVLVLVAIMALAAVLGASGQILLKIGSTQLSLINWYIFGFAALYGVAVLINIFAYRMGGKVSVLYPVISLSYIVAAILAWKFLGEPLNTFTLLGIFCIMIGVSIIGYGATV